MGMKLYSVQLQEKYNRQTTADTAIEAPDNVDTENTEGVWEIRSQLAFIGCMLEKCLQEPGEVTELTEYGKHHYEVLLVANDRKLTKENEQVKLALDVFQHQRHLAYRFIRTSTPAAAPVRSRFRHRDRAGDQTNSTDHQIAGQE